jgi:S1-C subfamily serine protease
MKRSKALILISFLAGAAAGSVLLPRWIGGPALAQASAPETSPYALANDPAPAMAHAGAPVPAPAQGQAPGQGLSDQDRMTEERSHNDSESRMTPVVRAVQIAGPSVVNIQVGRLLSSGGRRVFNKEGEGSGVIVDEEGLVISNWHVVRLQEQLANFYCRISLRNGKTYPARVLNTSPENDLALLLIETEEGENTPFIPMQLGDSESLMVGETVVAIGNPQGQANTVTSGVLSAVNRTLDVPSPSGRGLLRFKGLLQTDAAINPGNSGGALLDITGHLIGINTLMQKSSENIGFAIPVNKVKEVFQSNLLRYDKIDRFWTGLRVDESEGAVRVLSVVEQGPAWRAGLRRGDRVLAIEDKAVANLQDFGRALIRYDAGDKIKLRAEQKGSARELVLVPWARGRRRSSNAPASSLARSITSATGIACAMSSKPSTARARCGRRA